jgi:hypothetical protein
MSFEINLNDIFKNIIDNINNQEQVNSYINIICNNFYNIDYNKLIEKIFSLLDDANCILLFVNKLIDKLIDRCKYEYKFFIIDISKYFKKTDIIKFKNLSLLDIINHTTIYNIVTEHKIDIQNLINIYEFIYEIGKINIIDDLLNNIILDQKLLTYNVLFTIVLGLLKFQKKLLNTDFYINITTKLSKIMYIILPLFELKEFIQVYLFSNLENTHNLEYTHIDEHIIIIFDFFKLTLNNIDKYFDISILDNIFELLNVITKLNINDNIYINIIDDIYKLLQK